MSIEFEKVRIGDLGKVVTGKTPPTAREEYFGTDYPFITPTDIDGSKRHVETERYLSQESKKDFNNYLLPSGSICFVCIGATIGKICMTKGPSFTNQQINSVIVDGKRYDNCFVYYLLSTKKENIKNIAGGAATPIVNKSAFSDVFVEVPELIVQQKIAAILSNYDDLIENNLRRIKILEEMAQTLYREWFVKFRFPGHQKVKMVNSPLGKIPEGWEVTPLNNLCIRITDGSHSSPKSVEMGYPMASVKDMRDWALDEDSCRRIAESDYSILVRNDCKPLVNDVLIAKDGSYLKHAFVVEEEKELVILSSIAILRPNLEQIFPHILCMYLRQPEVRSRLSGYVSGVALPRIILKDFAKFLAVKPEIPLQTQFMMAVEPFVCLIHVLIKKNLTLRRTRDLLLPKLISGELDVSELDINIPEANA